MKKHNPIDIRPIAEQDNSLEHVIICDLDGTIALNYQNRSYYGDKCAEGIKYDTPFSPVISLLKNSGLPIIFVTGRHGSIDVINETFEWIKSQGLKIYKIYFRKVKEQALIIPLMNVMRATIDKIPLFLCSSNLLQISSIALL